MKFKRKSYWMRSPLGFWKVLMRYWESNKVSSLTGVRWHAFQHSACVWQRYEEASSHRCLTWRLWDSWKWRTCHFQLPGWVLEVWLKMLTEPLSKDWQNDWFQVLNESLSSYSLTEQRLQCKNKAKNKVFGELIQERYYTNILQ